MMCQPKWKGVLPLCTGISLHCLIVVFLALLHLVQAQGTATSATLNDPSSATSIPSKGNGVNSNSSSSPASTSVVPVPLSTQMVPFLLKVPQSVDASNGQRDAYFTGCSDSSSVGYVPSANRVNVSSIYSQIDRYTGDSAMGNGYPFSAGTLRVVGIGTVGNESYAFNSYTDSTGATTGLLSAIQVSTRFSTLPVFSNYTYLCNRLYPTQNDSQHPDVNPASCQYGPGTVSFGIDVPLNSTYEAGALTTEIRLTDSSSPALTIACIQLHSSPYIARRWYWSLLMWLPVALAAVFFLLAVFATLLAAEGAQRRAFKNRAREGGAPRLFRDKLSPMMVSALSGRDLVSSPPLLRYVTPGCWDIIYHLQFIVAIAMCHVQWPDFAYPFLRQAAWSTLLGNVTLTQSDRDSIDPLSTEALLPSGDLGNQMSNAASPLYMNATQRNILLNLQHNGDGIETYASMIGLQSENLFGTCLGIWLIMVAAIVVLSAFIWLIDSLFKAHERSELRKEQASLPLSSSSGPERPEMDELKAWDKDQLDGLNTSSKPKLTRLAGWRSAMGLHGKALHGNLIRALLLFHLPITIVSTYQFSLANQHSTVSVALAGLAFAILSVLVPVYIIIQIAKTPLKKLYEHVETLLSIGSAYHLYSPGSQLFCVVTFAHSLILGVVVGAGQHSGAAQAIIILIFEVLAALASSLWLPWGEGAMMGPLSFMANVVRIISAILILLLTSLVGLSFSARIWITYVILLLQGIYIVGALLVILVKTTEGLVRMIWKVRFDDGKAAIRTAGLGGAIRKIKRRKLKKQHRRSNSSSLRLQRIKLDHRMSGMSDVSTNTLSHMLGNAQQIPMSDARTGSYAEYLGTGMARPPNSHIGSFNRLNEESGAIMAALPPVSPRAGLSSPGQAFVRTGGGKATDANSYAALPTQDSPPLRPPHHRPRPQSQSGIVGNWTAEEARPRTIADPQHSYFALSRVPQDELTSTQAAALAARKSMLSQQQQQQQPTNQQRERKPANGKSFPWAKAKSKSKQEADDEDGWSDEGMTWDSNAAAQDKGAWAGVAKMSAALTSIKKNILGEKKEAQNRSYDEDDNEPELGSLPPSGSGGFEVVRAIRPQQQVLVTPTKMEAPATQVKTDLAEATNVGESPQTEHRSHLGMLGADLERVASSVAHTEEGGEDRFWLPPLDLGTEQGKL